MANSQGDEALFRADLVALLREKLKAELARRRLMIEENAKVLYDITATVEKGRFEPRLGFLEQDIVLFSRADVDPQLAEYFRNTKDLTWVRVPHLVIETKYKGISSHALMTYSNVANKIKGIFANARYFLLLRFDDKSRETILRHGTGFDRIIQLEKFKSNGQVPRYSAGALLKDWSADRALRERIEQLISKIKTDLSDEKLIC